MSKLTFASWNVNGVRAVSKKGFYDWLAKEKPDIVGIQETKISSDQLNSEISNPPGYVSYWSHAEKRGYSGVALFVRERPDSISEGIGKSQFDKEGRALVADYGDFVILNIYFPNGKRGEERLNFKLGYYDAFLTYAEKLRKSGKKLIICGDFNTAHKEIDLANPKGNVKISGFLPEERAWMDKFTSKGYLDTFRMVNDEPDNYTWWHVMTNARARNVGWRIDYFFIGDELVNCFDHATIQSEIMGSDHCPVTLTLKL